MNGISSIDTSRLDGMDMVSNRINPSQTIDPAKAFSRFLDEAANREKAVSENFTPEISGEPSLAGVSAESTPGIMPRNTKIDKTDKLYEQCQALETFLVKNILTAMRSNVMKSSLIDTGYAGELYEDMLWDEYAKDYQKTAGFGLADLAYLELTGQRGRKA